MRTANVTFLVLTVQDSPKEFHFTDIIVGRSASRSDNLQNFLAQTLKRLGVLGQKVDQRRQGDSCRVTTRNHDVQKFIVKDNRIRGELDQMIQECFVFDNLVWFLLFDPSNFILLVSFDSVLQNGEEVVVYDPHVRSGFIPREFHQWPDPSNPGTSANNVLRCREGLRESL